MLYQNKSFIILGLGVSGKAVAKYLLKKKAKVTAFEINQTITKVDPEINKLIASGMRLVFDMESVDPARFSSAVISPGFHPKNPLSLLLKERGIPFIGEIEIALSQAKKPCIGVTGTNGKTTVVSLITHVLKCSQINAVSVGNIGLPFIESIHKGLKNDIFVVELSSFQLETIKTKNLLVSCLLNITPDHLERYETFDHYAKQKLHIFNLLKKSGVAVIFDQVYEDYKDLCQVENRLIYGKGFRSDLRIANDSFIFKNHKLPLPNINHVFVEHDMMNMAAAFACCQYFGINFSQFLKALDTFKKPRHRLEFVREINGVMFFNDSKGTNLDAAVQAVHSMKGNVHLIAGGLDKGGGYKLWREQFGGKVKKVYAIGEAKTLIKNALEPVISVDLCNSLSEALDSAYHAANCGDSVLLSPGCASYDMFKSYVHRGEVFTDLVKML